jgi:dipeptidase E
MMRLWRRRGVDTVLKEAYQRGIVLSGLSAGAICWFRFGCSDSRKFSRPDAGFIAASGLGLVNATLCPHYDAEETRKPDLREMMRRTPGVALALGECCAIRIVDDRYAIIRSKPEANAYRVYWSAGKCHEEIIEGDMASGELHRLLAKQTL